MNEQTYFQIAPRINKFLTGWKENGKTIVLVIFFHMSLLKYEMTFKIVLYYYNYLMQSAIYNVSIRYTHTWGEVVAKKGLFQVSNYFRSITV